MKKISISIICIIIVAAVQPIIGAGSVVVDNNIIIPLDREYDNADWVLMFYQNGDNKLSNYIGICLNLIASVGATDDVKIAVLIDKKPVNDTTLYYYEGTNAVQQDWPEESDMSDPDTLVQFAERVMNDYPSENYLLEITANKGSGWQGICYDEHSKDGLMITMPEIFDALDTITENGCFKLDVTLIQSCLAGNYEFRYQIKQFCNYYVGYADCGLVGDIPFDAILSDLVADPQMNGEQLSTTIVDHFEPQQIQDIYQAMGATDSYQLDELTNNIDEMAVWFIDNFDTYEADIQSALEETRKYGLEFDIDYYVDLKDFLDHISISEPDFLDIKNSIIASIENAVIADVSLEGYPSCGFNFYFPNIKEDYNNALRYDHALPSGYEETLFSKDTNWDEFLLKYLDLLDNTHPEITQLNGPNEGKPNEEYEFVITSNDAHDDLVCYYIDWGDGSFQWTDLDEDSKEVIVKHTWESEKTYEVKVKAIDQFCADSDWSKLNINIPREKTLFNYQFLDIFAKIYPILKIFIQIIT
jgi:hypothetical protein